VGVGRRSYGEFHTLRPSRPQLARHNDLATLGTTLHDEPQHTIAGSPHSQTIEQLVSKRLALRNSRETAVLDFGGVQGDGVLGEFEAFLDEGGEFADATALFA
jgi:hypothetical protein